MKQENVHMHVGREEMKSLVSRLPLYVVGVFSLGFGIVLCVKCGLGVSPINCIPYVLSNIWPLSLGLFTIVFYLVNMAISVMLSERKRYLGIALQLPVALVFGLVIDMWNALLPAAGTAGMKLLCLVGSLVFTAFGIMLLVATDLVPDPPTGTIESISRFTKKKVGSVKVAYDCCCVIISLLIGLLVAHQNIGFGIATIVSALCVGKLLALMQKTVGKRIASAWR